MSNGQRYICRWGLGAMAWIMACNVILLIGALSALAAAQPVKVVVLRDWPPQYQLDGAGYPDGFAIDTIKGVAASAGLKLTFTVVDDWEDAFAAMQSGQADLIPNQGITLDRQKWLSFTSPVETFPVVIFVRSATSDIRSPIDLAGRVVATVKYNVGTRLMQDRRDIEHRIFVNVKETLLELLAGHVDAIIYPQPVFMKLAKDSGIADHIKVAGPPLVEIKRAISVRKDNDALLALLEPAVQRFVLSKQYAEIYAKWYGHPKPFWTPKRIVLVMTGLVFIIAFWHNIRVIKVNRRLNRSIAKQKKMGAALRASEEKYRLIVENQSDLIVRMDARGRLRFASPSFDAAIGNFLRAYQGRSFVDLVHPEDRETVTLAMQSLQVAPNACLHEGRMMTPKGWRWFSWSNKALVGKSGAVKKIIAVGRDVTERKEADLRLKASEEKFRAIFEQAADAVVLINRRTLTITDFNSVAHQSLGYTREAFARINLKGLIVPNPPDSNATVIARIMGSQADPVEAKLRDKSGQMRYFLMTLRPLFFNGDQLMLGIWHDITDRKKLEEHLVHSQKMEAIGTLAGGVAHDFNNILSIILGNTELAIEDVDLDHPVIDRLKEIQTASMRAREVIRQLLSFSRQEPANHVPVLLAPLVEESLQLLRASIPTTIDIRRHINVTDIALLADATQIHQILLNLCTNAAQAMDATGGTIDITLLSTAIDDRAAKRYGVPAGAYAQIRVQDNGCGMHPEILERVFDPYYTTKKAHEGTGMGLSIVHGIVTRHGGTVDVESHVGRGTIFKVFLPLVKNVQTAEADKVDPPDRGKEHILLVDDEAGIVDLGSEYLGQLGYRVQAFDSAPDALHAFKSNPRQFDLAITDMIMPKMTGEILTQQILKIRPGFPVIICSGYPDKVDEKRLSSMGVKAFLRKPFPMSTLANTIRRVLAGKMRIDQNCK